MPASKTPKSAEGKPVTRLDPKIKAIAERVKEHLTTLYGPSIRQVFVYGDYARGTAGPDAILEIAAIVDDTLIPRDVEKTLEDLLFDVLMEDRELSWAIILPESMFKDYASPLILALKSEGVAV